MLHSYFIDAVFRDHSLHKIFIVSPSLNLQTNSTFAFAILKVPGAILGPRVWSCLIETKPLRRKFTCSPAQMCHDEP
jgi:hypothetical protein